VIFCSGKNGVYFMLCSVDFGQTCTISHFMHRIATAVYMEFCRVLPSGVWFISICLFFFPGALRVWCFGPGLRQHEPHFLFACRLPPSCDHLPMLPLPHMQTATTKFPFNSARTSCTVMTRFLFRGVCFLVFTQLPILRVALGLLCRLVAVANALKGI
jgi:hypothetical protein